MLVVYRNEREKKAVYQAWLIGHGGRTKESTKHTQDASTT